ncbi:hypothetical protein AKJ37_05820 [candidate division MSBL1 archaeon SCGC-AAA259I09]|uniref:Integrase catalytic domain-containing protein n=1 Tax=candidate division MSBL1 archaeon SCGC-AAA259I09 TaxID=1698267 RepID=A0A133UPT1_9EURY|nr:hypothetical protein AKJ37_05820 [candidate division MSBL1 archaeon SCGC-AAA259I09]
MEKLRRKPEKILTDNGNQFKLKWKRWCRDNEIETLFAHPYYPQDKGKVERTIKNVAEEFVKLLNKFPEWLKNIWRKHGVHDALRDALSERKTEFDLERIIFLLTVNRLYNPGSDLSALEWMEETAFPPKDVEKQWVYRSLDMLIEEKDTIEENLLENLKESLVVS